MSNSPFRLCLRIGTDLVASNQHFSSLGQANNARQKLLATPTFRSQKLGSVGVRVMHWSTFNRLVDKGDACTVRTLQQNAEKYGDAIAQASQLYRSIQDLFNSLADLDAKRN